MEVPEADGLCAKVRLGRISVSMTETDPNRCRWILIAAQSFYSFVSSVAIMCYFPIATAVALDMNVSVLSITYLEMTTWFIAGFGKLPGMWSADRKGPLPNLTIGVSCIVVGCAIRLIPYSFAALCVGTVICQIGQTFVQVLPALITEMYFPNKEKALAINVAVVAEFFGAGVGMFIGSLFARNVNSLWIFTGLLPLGGIPLYCVTMKSIDNRNTAKNIDMIPAIKQLFRNTIFRRCFFALGIVFGVFNALLSNISSIAPPNMAHENAGLYALIFFSSGMVGAAIIGHAVDRFEISAFTASVGCSLCCFVFLCIQGVFWVNNQQIGVLITAGLTGFFGPSLPSLLMRHLLEKVNCDGIESVMNALLLISYAIAAAILTPICNPHVLHLPEPNNVYIFWILLVISVPGLIIVLFINPKNPAGLEDVEMSVPSMALLEGDGLTADTELSRTSNAVSSM